MMQIVFKDIMQFTQGSSCQSRGHKHLQKSLTDQNALCLI